MAKKRKEAAKKPAGEGERDGREGCLPDDVAVGRKEGLAFLAVHSRPGNCRAHGPSAAAWRRLLTSATLSGPFVASCRTAPWSLSATLRHSCVFPLAFRHHVCPPRKSWRCLQFRRRGYSPTLVRWDCLRRSSMHLAPDLPHIRSHALFASAK